MLQKEKVQGGVIKYSWRFSPYNFNAFALLTLSDLLVRKVDENGMVNPGDSKVKASFSTIIKDWNDILLTLSLPHFEIVGLEGFIFNVERAVFDFSDTRTADGIRYPTGYEEQYMIPGNANLWKGIYIRDLSVLLPPQFASKDSESKRIGIAAHDMLFDNNGISGLFDAENVLTYNTGSAGGWPFSVERFSLELIANRLTGAGFGGHIGLPAAKESPLRYDAFISPDNEYMLRVGYEEVLNFDIWAARVELLPNSYVELKVKDGKFRPEAMLSGSMTICAGAKSGGEGMMAVAEFKGVKFRELHLKTEAPFLMVKYLGYEGDALMKNFPLSIDNIALETRGNEVRLGFDAILKLGSTPFEMKAETSLAIVGKIEESRGLQSWKYEKIDVSRISVDTEIAGVFSIKGSIAMLDDDPIYGDGFAGSVDLELGKAMPGLKIKARAIFGKKEFRYWLVDGSATFGGQGLPVFPPISLNGIGGGAYYRMAQRGVGESSLPTNTVYVPDEKRGFGFKAAVMLNIAAPAVVSGEASFEMAFNHNGGLAYMGFFGHVKILGEIPGMKYIAEAVNDKFGELAVAEADYLKSHPGQEAGLDKLQKYKMYQPTAAAKEVFPADEPLDGGGFMAAIGIQYDFNRNSFHASLDVYVNVLAGLIKGRGPGGSAGSAVVHIEPGNWYMHLGTPTNRLGVELNLLKIVTIKTGAYFMTGSHIDGSPPPPQQVADILGIELEKLDYMRDFNALEKGGGFAFGADFSVATGDLTFLIVYANFQTGLGFDIMMKNYGEAQCEGRRGPVGIDGWYANGQAYAYLQGEAGINLKLLFVKKKIPIIKAGAATLFQAKLPNPAWFAGYLGIKFDLLGGLVKGKIRLKITFGEECKLVMPGGSPLGIPVINDIKPEDQTADVDVFTAPQVAFNMPIGKSFEMEEDAGPKSYRLVLDEFSVSDNGQILPGKLEWNANRDVVSFYSHDILPPQKKLTIVARVNFEEWRNGHWEIVYTGGQKAYEQMEASFTTGTAPDIIPLHNVEYSYPVMDQQFFLAGESGKGYVRLKRGQPYLFAPEFLHEVQLTDADGGVQKMELGYDAANCRVNYMMPDVDARSKYNLGVVTLAKNGGQSSANIQQDEQLGADGDDITLRTNTAVDVVRADVGKVLLEYNFMTSRYKTFAEKMQGIVLGGSSPWRDSYYTYLRHRIKSMEPFDETDLVGTKYSGNKPLLEPIATLDDSYYLKDIYPLVYEKNLSNEGIEIQNRDVSIYGAPPAKAIFIAEPCLAQIEQNYFTTGEQLFPFTYNLFEIYERDYYDLRSQVINKYLDNLRLSNFEKLVNSYFPSFPDGVYKTEIKYRQPDGTAGSGSMFNFEYIF